MSSKEFPYEDAKKLRDRDHFWLHWRHLADHVGLMVHKKLSKPELNIDEFNPARHSFGNHIGNSLEGLRTLCNNKGVYFEFNHSHLKPNIQEVAGGVDFLISTFGSLNQGKKIGTYFETTNSARVGDFGVLYFPQDTSQNLITFVVDKILKELVEYAKELYSRYIQELRLTERDEVTRKDIETLFLQGRIDHLTGLNNRLALHEFHEELAKTDQNSGWSLVMLDLDFFKQVNDTFGHDKGDKTLELVARALSAFFGDPHNIRAFRTGGEEFTIMIPVNDDNTDCLKKIQSRIREILVPLDQNDLNKRDKLIRKRRGLILKRKKHSESLAVRGMQYSEIEKLMKEYDAVEGNKIPPEIRRVKKGEGSFQITASIGEVILELEGGDIANNTQRITTAMTKADENSYDAKRSGRNQIISGKNSTQDNLQEVPEIRRPMRLRDKE